MRIVKDLKDKKYNPWNKGKRFNRLEKDRYYTKERNNKISNALKGKCKSKEHIENIKKSHLGYIMPDSQKLKIKNNPNNIRTQFKKGHKGDTYWKGKHMSEKVTLAQKEWRMNTILPTRDTSIEIKIQNFLKQLNIDFFTHQYIKQIEHGYQCDVLIPSMNLIIECDGNYWHKYPIGREIDKIRTKELIEKGFKVLRLWEHEINNMQLEDFKIILCEK